MKTKIIRGQIVYSPFYTHLRLLKRAFVKVTILLCILCLATFSFGQKNDSLPYKKKYRDTISERAKTHVDTLMEKSPNSISTEPNKSSNAPEQKGKFGGFTFEIDVLSIILSILIGSVLIAFMLKKNRIERIRELKKLETRIPEYNFSSNTKSRNSDPNSLKKEIDLLKNEIHKIRNEISIASIPFEVIPPTDLNEIFYLSIPDLNGSFPNGSIHHTYREGVSLYVFSKVSKENAHFHIENHASSIKMALMNPEVNIDPFCDSDNTFHPKKTKIITVKEGEVKLTNDKWVLVRKAIIRYEH